MKLWVQNLKVAAVKIQAAREFMGLAYEDLGPVLGISASGIGDILNGKRGIDLEDTVRLARKCSLCEEEIVPEFVEDYLRENYLSDSGPPEVGQKGERILGTIDTALRKSPRRAVRLIAWVICSPDASDTQKMTALAMFGHWLSYASERDYAITMWNAALFSDLLNDPWIQNVAASIGGDSVSQGGPRQIREGRVWLKAALDRDLEPHQVAYVKAYGGHSVIMEARELESMSPKDLLKQQDTAAEALLAATSADRKAYEVMALGQVGFFKAMYAAQRHLPEDHRDDGFDEMESALGSARDLTKSERAEYFVRVAIYYSLAMAYRFPASVNSDTLSHLDAAEATARAGVFIDDDGVGHAKSGAEARPQPLTDLMREIRLARSRIANIVALRAVPDPRPVLPTTVVAVLITLAAALTQMIAASVSGAGPCH